MEMALELSARARTLRCVANGRVVSLSELQDGFFSRRLMGDGFAVRLRKRRELYRGRGFFAGVRYHLLTLIQPPEFVEIVSPADGVVTASGEYLSLRTGDGVNVSVFHGANAEFIPQVGEKVRRGAAVCIAERAALQESLLGGAVVVLFTEPQQITELHILTGRHRTGERVAFFKKNK